MPSFINSTLSSTTLSSLISVGFPFTTTVSGSSMVLGHVDKDADLVYDVELYCCVACAMQLGGVYVVNVVGASALLTFWFQL